MSWLTSSGSDLTVVAAKTVLMYTTALVGLRLAERRTLAQWTIIDFVAAVAVGAIVGRTAVAQSQSYAVGAVALLTIIVAHRLASLLRFRPVLGKLTDHRLRVLVTDGQLQRGQLRRCGLTDHDLYAELRQRGVFDLGQVRYVLYEAKGGLTVVPSQSTTLPRWLRQGWTPPRDSRVHAPAQTRPRPEVCGETNVRSPPQADPAGRAAHHRPRHRRQGGAAPRPSTGPTVDIDISSWGIRPRDPRSSLFLWPVEFPSSVSAVSSFGSLSLP